MEITTRTLMATISPPLLSKELSPRQKQIAEMLLGGETRKGIAMKLNINQATVNKHIYRIQQKTGQKNIYAALGVIVKNWPDMVS